MKFFDVLNDAIEDMLTHGFDSKQRLDRWLHELAQSAKASLVPEKKLQLAMRSALERSYAKATGKKLLQVHKGVSAFTLNNIKPKLRDELDRRIHAMVNLIELNRDAAITKTLQRFAGWATSVPAGGTDAQTRKETKKIVRRGIAALPFEERRVIIDQGHKLVAAINDIVAVDGGAIAARWKHIKESPEGYDARPDHVARDGKVYLFRNSWAHARGLVKPLGCGFTDSVTQPAEEPFCRCYWEFLYALRDLPEVMLTAKGKQELLAVREKLRMMVAS